MNQLLPDWAQPFPTASDADDYWDLVYDVATTRWGDDVICNYVFGTIRSPAGGTAHIDNIARDAARVPDIEARRRALYSFFSLLDDHSPERLAAQLEDWDWVRPRLRLRLMARFDAGFEHVRRPVDRRTDWVLALEITDGCLPIGVDVAACWPMGTEELWRLGQLQSLAASGVRRVQIWQAPSIVCFEGGMFTSGLLTDLSGRLPTPVGPLGALVTAPTAHRCYVVPIRHTAIVPEAVVRLMSLSLLDQHTEPNRLSPSILWYRGAGVLEPGISVGPSGIEVDLDEPLRTALEQDPGPAAA